MTYRFLTAAAVALTLANAHASDVSNNFFMATSPYQSMRIAPDGTVMADEGVAWAFSYSAVSFSVDEFDVTFLAQPGYQIDSVGLFASTHTYVDTWDGPEFDSSGNPTQVLPTADASYTSKTVAVPGGFEVTGRVSLYAAAASFCYTAGLCWDGYNSDTLTATAALDFLQFSVDAIPVPEPLPSSALLAGLVVIASLKRRRVV